MNQNDFHTNYADELAHTTMPTKPTETATPRTDVNKVTRQYVCSHSSVGKEEWYVDADFARQLESELAEARSIVESQDGKLLRSRIEIENQNERLDQLRTENESLKRQVEENDKEIGKFQNDAKALIDELTGANVDGAGCDGGDWRDFTLSEISQGLAFVIDERDSLKAQLAQYQTYADSEIKLLKGNLEEAIREHERMEKRLAEAVKDKERLINELKKFNKIVSDYERGTSKVPWICVRESLAELMTAIDSAITATKEGQ